jgi:cytochrome c-type biogenesis protein
MRDLLIGGTLLAGFLGGAVALFAPCCISVMLPAYFATSFGRRRALVSMTFVFALGVAAIILPIAFGASGISRLISGHHTTVFGAGALLMLAMGGATLLGWKPSLPMVGMRARTDRGPAAVFALGVFSGVASACCAPVLAGVVALSGAASSFPVAMAVGVAYVFGMVGPLFVIALLWDRYDWGNSALLRGRVFSLRGRPVQSASLASGVLLMAMGVLTFVLALTGPSMPTKGWQVTLTVRLQHYAHNILSALSGLPGWAFGILLAGALAALVWIAVGQSVTEDDDTADEEPYSDHTPPTADSTKHGTERV